MKHTTVLIIILSVFANIARGSNYSIVDTSRIFVYRESYNDVYNAINNRVEVDSVVYHENSQVLYFRNSIRSERDVYLYRKKPSLMGKRAIVSDSSIYFVNKNEDSLIINSSLNIGERWEFLNIGDSIIYYAEVEEKIECNYLDITDSVHIIQIDVYANGSYSLVENAQIHISKNNGIVRTFDLYEFPSCINNYEIYAATNPEIGFRRLSWYDIYNMGENDTIVEKHRLNSYDFNGEYTGYYIEYYIKTLNSYTEDYGRYTFEFSNKVYGEHQDFKREYLTSYSVTTNPIYWGVWPYELYLDSTVSSIWVCFDECDIYTYYTIEQFNNLTVIHPSNRCNSQFVGFPIGHEIDTSSFFESARMCDGLTRGIYYLEGYGVVNNLFGVPWYLQDYTSYINVVYYKSGNETYGDPNYFGVGVSEQRSDVKLQVIHGNLNVESELDFISGIEVYNIHGNSILSESINSNYAELSIGEFTSGIYFVLVRLEGGETVGRKFILD